MVDYLVSLVNTARQTVLLFIEVPYSTPIQSVEGSSMSLIPIEHTSKESSKSPKSKECFKESSNICYPDKDLNENILKKRYELKRGKMCYR